MATLYVVDLEEFRPVLDGCRQSGYQVSGPHAGYWKVRGQPGITLVRKQIGLGPALWNTSLAGGVRGRVVDFNKDRLRIEPSS